MSYHPVTVFLPVSKIKEPLQCQKKEWIVAKVEHDVFFCFSVFDVLHSCTTQ